MVDRGAISGAYDVIAPHIRATPVIEVRGDDLGIEVERLVLKLEFMQYSGSFKARGAFANLLMRDVPPAGVVAASGGNHGAAVAYASQQLGVSAKIFVPGFSSPAKTQRIRQYGADLVACGDDIAEAFAASTAWADTTGAMSVHPFDQRETLLGTGTLGLELVDQVTGIDTVIVAVGGGGLLGGVASWFAGSVNVVGVEPEAAPTLTTALAAGRPVDAQAGGIAADSLGPRHIGELVYPIAERWANRPVLVTDEAIVAAQRTMWETLRIAVEPGGATAMAALLTQRYLPKPGERVAIVVSGANTDQLPAGQQPSGGSL